MELPSNGTDLSKSQPNNKPVRKKKLLADPESLWAKCKMCLELGNLENLIRHQLPIKDKNGVELYQAFTYIYFCSENCRGLFK